MNILILRLASWALITKLVSTCKERWPKATIYILLQKGALVEEEFEDVQFLYATGKSVSWVDIRKVVNEIGQVDIAFVPYNNIKGNGYLKYELSLLFSSVKEVFSFNPIAKEIRLNKFILLLRKMSYWLMKVVDFSPINKIFFLVSRWFLYIYIRFLKKSQSDYQIVFISHFGYRAPSSRIRAYNFSRALNVLGMKTTVVSVEDTIGLICDETYTVEKLISCFKLAKTLSFYKDAIFCVLKPDYHALAPYFFNRLFENKIIFDQDDWDFENNVFPTMNAQVITDDLLSVSSLNVVASNALLQKVKAKGYKACYIPTGVDTEFFRPNNSSDNNKKLVCGWIGMVWGQGIVDNLKYLFDCVKDIECVYVHIVAGGGDVEYVRRMGRSILGDRVRIDPLVDPDHIPDFINRIDVGVFPFVAESSYNEAKSPTKLFEFMACGKPSVVSPVGESKLVIRDGENGFLAKNKGDFVECIQKLANDSDLRRRIGENARKTVEMEYSLAHCARCFRDSLLAEGII